MSTIYIISLEPVESRYTIEWYRGIPNLFKKRIKDKLLEKIYNVVQIDGLISSTETTPGAFLDFSSTNIWKSSQLMEICSLIKRNVIKSGDQFLFTDFWNPCIIQLKYMLDLLNIDAKIHAIAHAGSYDPQDFLGRLISNKNWSYNFERSLLHAIDYTYVATNYHKKLILETLFIENDPIKDKIIISGQPHNIMIENLSKYKDAKKKNQIVFPHRISSEKQPKIFYDLEKELPQYTWIACQEKKLKKEEYHTILSESKMVFSANLQETLGISMIEGILVHSIPFVPDRLSYSEMYLDSFKYPSEWTSTFENYQKNKESLKNKIIYLMENYDSLQEKIVEQKNILNSYINADIMIGNMIL